MLAEIPWKSTRVDDAYNDTMEMNFDLMWYRNAKIDCNMSTSTSSSSIFDVYDVSVSANTSPQPHQSSCGAQHATPPGPPDARNLPDAKNCTCLFTISGFQTIGKAPARHLPSCIQ